MLTALLWGDRGDRQARHSLSQSLSAIRATFGDALRLVTTSREAITLATDGIDVDVALLRQLGAGEAVADLQAAAELYRGPLLDGFNLREPGFEEWLTLERSRLHELAIAVVRRLAGRQAATQDRDGAAASWHRAQSLDPLSEETHRQVMRLHLDRGAYNAAIRHYLVCVEILKKQLGTCPEPSTTGLYREAVDLLASQPDPAPEQRAPAAPLRAAGAGDRKQATALSAAVLLSGDAEARPDPEEMHAAVETALADIARAVIEGGGSVLRRDADTILAAFGLPVAIEDHAARACRTALAIAAGLEQRHGGSLRVAIALDSGEVVRFADGGPEERPKAVGHCLSRAARLASSGRIRAVAVTAATRELARSAIQFAPLDPVPLDLGASLIEVYAPTGVQTSATGFTARRRLARFVGREAELDAMAAVFAPIAEGRGQLVAVVGEPGVGKSRLCYELLRHRVPAEWRTVHCRADSQLAAAAYVAIAGMLRSFFGVADEADRDLLRERVLCQVQALDVPPERVVPAVLAVLDALPAEPSWDGLEPGQKRLRVIDAVKTLLRGESSRRPLVLAVEDLHWLDAASRQVLDGVVDALPGMRVLMLVNYRPEYAHDWARRSYFRQIPVSPLPTAGAQEMLDALIGTDPSTAPLKARLVARAGGNPFFLEECVRALVVSDAFDGRPGGYRLAREVDRLVLPETVQAVIAARLDRLPPGDKQLLQIAAAIGTETPLTLLERVAGVPEEPLRCSLSRLQAEEFLFEVRAHPEPVYEFKHALTHEVAYSSLLQHTRRELHARILAAIEELGAPQLADHLDALASHAMRGQSWEKAVDYARQAGLRAAARSANRAAVVHFEQALAALGHLPATPERLAQEIDFRFDIRNALFVLGEHEAIARHLRHAETLVQRIGDRRRLGHAALHLSGWSWQQGQHRQALAAGRRGLAIARDEQDGELLDLGWYRYGLALHGLGDYSQAAEAFRTAMAGLERRGAVGRLAFGGYPYIVCCSYLAWSLAELGELDAAEECGRNGWRVAGELGQTYTRTVISFGLGHCHVRQGRLDEALPVLEEGLRLYDVHEVPTCFAWIGALLGYVYVRQGQVERGIDLLRKTIDPELRRRSVLYAHPFLWLGEALLHLGRPAEAAAAVWRGHGIAAAQEEAAHQAWAERLLGDITAPEGPAAAAGHYRAAIVLGGRSQLRPLVAAARAGLSSTLPPVPQMSRLAPRPLVSAEGRPHAALVHGIAGPLRPAPAWPYPPPPVRGFPEIEETLPKT